MKLFVVLLSLSMTVLMSSCAAFDSDEGRFTASYQDYSCDVMLYDDGSLKQVWLEGPTNKSWLGECQVYSGQTPDGRQYLSILRFPDDNPTSNTAAGIPRPPINPDVE